MWLWLPKADTAISQDSLKLSTLSGYIMFIIWKVWHFWTVVLEKILKSPMHNKEFKPVHPKGNQPWIFIGRTDAKAEAPILWPPNVKNLLSGKDPDAGKDWWQKEKRVAEDERVR